MNSIVVLAGIAGAVLVAGCASQPPTDEFIDGLIVCNATAMEKVERQAKRSLKEVRWMHCPTEVIRVVKPTPIQRAANG